MTKNFEKRFASCKKDLGGVACECVKLGPSKTLGNFNVSKK